MYASSTPGWHHDRTKKIIYMKSKISLFLLSVMFLSLNLFAQQESDVIEYISRYKVLAIEEQVRSGVPAAITLAQGIHESTAGHSELATKANNHFGIKCKTSWMGETMLHDDDKKQECFRKYVSAEQSYIDHSDFLKTGNRYHFLFDLEPTDFTGWASGLKRAGYATNPMYVKKLTDLIEKYNLQQYTYEAIARGNRPGEVAPNEDKPRNLTQVDDPSTYYKGLKGFWAKKGETLLPKALERNIRYAKLLTLNDLSDEPLRTDMFVFLEKKRRVGTEEFHVVKENESMLLISQKEAMLLSNLYAYNNLVPGQDPEAGEKLVLQYKSYETPKIRQQFLKEFDTPPAFETVIARIEETQTEPVEKKVVRTEPSPEKLREKPVSTVPIITEEKKTEPIAIEKEEKSIPEPEGIEQPSQQENASPFSNRTEALVEQKTEELTIEPERTATEIVPEKGILDAEKAAKMEALLNSEPLESNTTETRIIKKETVNESPFAVRNTSTAKPIQVAVEKAPETTWVAEEVVPAEVIPELAPVRVKRTYNEPGISDSVKSLKKRFDDIVYSPRVPKKDTAKKSAPILQKTTTEVKKRDSKTTTTQPVQKKDEEKKSNVQVTKTGIKREIQKETETKRKVVEKPEIKKNGKATATKQTDAKKKTTGKKETTPTKKKASTAKKPAPAKKPVKKK